MRDKRAHQNQVIEIDAGYRTICAHKAHEATMHTSMLRHGANTIMYLAGLVHLCRKTLQSCAQITQTFRPFSRRNFSTRCIQLHQLLLPGSRVAQEIKTAHQVRMGCPAVPLRVFFGVDPGFFLRRQIRIRLQRSIHTSQLPVQAFPPANHRIMQIRLETRTGCLAHHVAPVILVHSQCDEHCRQNQYNQ